MKPATGQQQTCEEIVTEQQAESRFWELWEKIEREDTVESSVPDLELSLLELLAFMKSQLCVLILETI
ncbi:hypothetical protein [Duganella hordei]|uniref:hypothetical protein n=1 Tax=Duganella hordei TaxID=2865934 RepID=UPI00333EF167